MQYHRHNRRKYLLLFHIIFVVKYRRAILTPEIVATLKQSLSSTQAVSEFSISEMEVDGDHLHMMIDLSPNFSISQVVRRLKHSTTRDLWSEHNGYLKKRFWRERTFWSDGYFASSIGNASIETVRQYIQNQG